MHILARRGYWRRENLPWAALLSLFLALVSCAVLIPNAPASPTAREAGDLDDQEVVDRLLQSERQRFADIESLTRIAHYTANDRRFGVQADMVARMFYEKSTGKRFEVISRSGSSTIQSRIFDGLMTAEIDAAKKRLTSGPAISPANYQFHLLGQVVYDGRKCYLLQLRPRQKNEHLINGKAWVDASDFEIVHEEGRPSASVSFWIGKPMITEDYEKIGKFWVAKRRYSVSDSFLLGRSELTIEYSDYHIVEAKPRNTPATHVEPSDARTVIPKIEHPAPIAAPNRYLLSH
ncbi:MAG TPA: hypothetical protein VHZ07_25270 [Bryobacteraceae bacterium]|nr:hypothetical protein [Bryobacteraceae bacterium]